MGCFLVGLTMALRVFRLDSVLRFLCQVVLKFAN